MKPPKIDTKRLMENAEGAASSVDGGSGFGKVIAHVCILFLLAVWMPAMAGIYAFGLMFSTTVPKGD